MKSAARKEALCAERDEIIEALCAESDDMPHVKSLLARLELLHIIITDELWMIDDEEEIKEIIAPLISSSEKQLAQYRAGKEKVWGYFFGQSMRLLADRAEPEALTAVLKEALAEDN